jgi:hypothetical protein
MYPKEAELLVYIGSNRLIRILPLITQCDEATVHAFNNVKTRFYISCVNVCSLPSPNTCPTPYVLWGLVLAWSLQ